MPVERAGEEGRLPRCRREEVHQLRLAAERRDGPAVGHRLAERGQVGRDAGDRLVAAEPVAEARDHLVEDEHGPVLRRELAQPLEKAGLRQDGADVVRDRLEDDRGDVVVGQRALDVVGVVEPADDRRLEHFAQDPLRERVLAADALRGRDHVHRHRVVPAVVAALELDHVAASGDGAREPERVEGRFASRRGQQHLLERGDDVDEPLCELDLDRGDADAHQPRLRRRRQHRRRGRCARAAAARRRRDSRCRRVRPRR